MTETKIKNIRKFNVVGDKFSIPVYVTYRTEEEHKTTKEEQLFIMEYNLSELKFKGYSELLAITYSRVLQYILAQPNSKIIDYNSINFHK